MSKEYKRQIADEKDFLADLPAPPGGGSFGGTEILRLRHFFEDVADADGNLVDSFEVWSSIPVMIERPENHAPFGGNVLYLDGHVEFIRYPGKWPMTDQSIAIFESLDAL